MTGDTEINRQETAPTALQAIAGFIRLVALIFGLCAFALGMAVRFFNVILTIFSKLIKGAGPSDGRAKNRSRTESSQ